MKNWFKIGILLISVASLLLAAWALNESAKQKKFEFNQACSEGNTLWVTYSYNPKTSSCEKSIRETEELDNCQYEILGKVIERASTSITYKGKIHNTSNKELFLKSMIAKVYSADGTLQNEGYDSFVIGNQISGKSMPPNTALEYQIKTGTNKDADSTVDIYPWFSNCK